MSILSPILTTGIATMSEWRSFVTNQHTRAAPQHRQPHRLGSTMAARTHVKKPLHKGNLSASAAADSGSAFSGTSLPPPLLLPVS